MADQPTSGNQPKVEGEHLDPFEIDFLPEFLEGRGPRGPFVNKHGVTIGDHDYNSPQSPLNHWSKNTDPAIMAGDEWVHPYKDIGFRSAENRDYFEKGIPPQAGLFTHPVFDVAYQTDWGQVEARPADNKRNSGKPVQ